MVKWEVREKIWGYNARKFKIKIVIKIVEIKISVLGSVIRNLNFTSVLKMFTIFLSTLEVVDVKIHVFQVKMEGISSSISQFNEKIELLGSNMENRLLIIL